MWFYSNFKQEQSLDGEYNSASNEYPLGILLVDPVPQKTRNTWKNVTMSSSSRFFMYFLFFVEQDPSKVCRVGTRWMQNWIPHPTTAPVQNLSKTSWRYIENTSWKSSFSLFNYFLSFYIFTQFFYHFNFKNGDSSPMIDIINLNPIGSYKVGFCWTFLFWGPFFTSKFL